MRLTALLSIALGSHASRAEEAKAPPALEIVEKDEKEGRPEEALAGWAARCLDGATAADRAQALARYVALASKVPSEPDAWLVDAYQRSGPGLKLVAGRRVVVAMTEEALAGADPKRLAALFDAAELAVEYIVGARPPVGEWTKADPRLRDRAGRFVIGIHPLPKPLADQAFETELGAPDAKDRGLALACSVASACAQAALPAAPNHRARLLAPAVNHVVRDLAVRQIGEPSAVARADEYRTRAKERYESDWASGCLPGEWIPNDEPLAHLFFLGLEAERAAKRDPCDAMHAFLTEPRRDSSGVGRVGSARDIALEPLAATFCPAFCDVFRRAGVLPVGHAFEEMKARDIAEEQCREAETLRYDDTTRGAAARGFRAAADTLGASIAADEAIIEALTIEEKDDPKKARSAALKLGLIEGFDFLAPLPQVWRQRDEVSTASKLLPLAVATAPGRHPFKVKEPIEVSLKWDDVKPNPYEKLFARTPWGDKRGQNNWGAAIATTKWKSDFGGPIRLRPCHGSGSLVVVLADGQPLDPWPDGSVIVPGAKGTEIVLTSNSRLTCSVPWREAKVVEADLAAVAAEKPAVLCLRPWAARKVIAALPAITAALAQSPDADFVRDVVLLAPYRGGDAATCDAMLAHAKGRPPVLAAYLDVCRGTRDAAVIDRLVALATASDVTSDTLSRVQSVLDGALFRRVAEAGPALAALWERGKKWMTATAFAEAEEIRDLHDSMSGFRVIADPMAWGRACLAPSGSRNGRGEGYLSLDVPEGTGPSWLHVRWQAPAGARLTLHGLVTDGKKTKPFTVDMPGAGSEKPEWTFDSFELGTIPRGRIVLAIDDPCLTGCKLDAIAISAKLMD